MKATSLSILFLVLVSQALGQDANQRQSEERVPGIFRDVELSDEQRQQVKTTIVPFRQQLAEIARKQNQIYTPEQQAVRRDSIRSARNEKKSNQELRNLVDQAMQLTDEQSQQIAALATERQSLQNKMRSAMMEVLTPEQKQKLGRNTNQNRRANQIAPTHADVAYGPYERNVMDVWLAKSDSPTPVLFAIHGGGFRGGNKSVDGSLLKACLDQGISVVAITYRLSSESIAPAQFHDSARAVQFVRSNASKWKIDKTRIASTGGSAGAGISMWLAFHDDLADPENKDLVLRESTRLSCAAVYNGQSTYDPREIKKMIPEAETFRESALSQLYGIDLSKGLDLIPADKLKLIEEVSPINHVDKDDVPVLMAFATDLETPITSQGIGIHHPRFGKLLKEKMEPLGLECKLSMRSKRGSEAWVNEVLEFVKASWKRP